MYCHLGYGTNRLDLVLTGIAVEVKLVCLAGGLTEKGSVQCHNLRTQVRASLVER